MLPPGPQPRRERYRSRRIRGTRMWVQMAEDGSLATGENGEPIPLGIDTPTSVMLPPGTPKARKTGTGVRDGYVVHFTGRGGTANDHLPQHIVSARAAQRVWMILRHQALLALRPFGRRYSFPTVCFCEGDATARALLVRDGRYSGEGIAFHRRAVERWGARPLVYADADIIDRLHEALARFVRTERHDFADGEQVQIDLVRALLVRDWPGSRENHPDSDVRGRSEWSHEHEMRLVLPTHDYMGSGAYWTFEQADVAHLLLHEDRKAASKLAQTAVKDGRDWILDLPVCLYGKDGRVVAEQALLELAGT